MSIKTGLLFFLTFCCINTTISGIIDHYCIMENFKKSGKNNNKREVQLQWTLAFKSQRVGYQSDQKLLDHCQHSKNQLNS